MAKQLLHRANREIVKFKFKEHVRNIGTNKEDDINNRQTWKYEGRYVFRTRPQAACVGVPHSKSTASVGGQD
jgi:hypothetical protein